MYVLLNMIYLVVLFWVVVIVVVFIGVCIYIVVLYILNCNWDKNIMLNILCFYYKYNNLEFGLYLRRWGGVLIYYLLDLLIYCYDFV